MNEPKKRGRPSKAEIAARTEAKAVMSSFSGTFAGKGEPIKPGESVQVYRDPFDVRLAQAYALRVYNGCSKSLYESEKLKIVKEALEGQGLSMDGVELPNG